MKGTMESGPTTGQAGLFAHDLPAGIRARSERALAALFEAGPTVVAFSGGADSALVLAMAVRALGADQVIAATSVAPSVARSELASAEAFAAELGVRHEWPRTQELRRADYRANRRDRCYFCKSELADTLLRLAEGLGCRTVATGTNADDAVDPFRPGIRAADERGVIAPLRDAGLTKREVREISRSWGLRTWNKPASPCLASRIAYGVPIDAARLERVEAAEASVREALGSLGVESRNLRVRDLGERVRIELDAPYDQLLEEAGELRSAIDRAGFTGVPLDVSAFRSGALNLLDT
ncbi:ATP-dependent sacrificial sulfur transferase LarE [Streptomyces cellostaticus]|uniref:ATP-dependent sacrificial sulfur transferase LarE n=1 Tax=Streptomyces cellostaticus TaxID=67285 RepID=UPI002026A62B|nr:ATP-dependent sacrificial sulfur transferase LarE [Streptomyces cellostaticus]